MMLPISQMIKLDIEKLSNLFKVTQIGSGRTRI